MEVHTRCSSSTKAPDSEIRVSKYFRKGSIPSNSIGMIYDSRCCIKVMLFVPGSSWTVEMIRLKRAGTYFEAIECLRSIRALLDNIDQCDRIRFCKADYDNATKTLRRHKLIWSNDLFHEMVDITLQYFDDNVFRRLPLAVLQDIMLWLPPKYLSQMSCVGRSWRLVCQSNEVWTILYINKFFRNRSCQMKLSLPRQPNARMDAFRERLFDPEVGDKIEVAWRGKFRLETQDVYQGLAWWLAEIVEKDSEQGKYKIRYPGWESRWDEWVLRCRLRWTVERNRFDIIEAGDVVELWCCGANVPGAWLESKVKKVRDGRYCLGRVLSSGLLWVERDRLRLVRKSMRSLDKESSGVTRASFSSVLSGFSERFRSMELDRSSCSIV